MFWREFLIAFVCFGLLIYCGTALWCRRTHMLRLIFTYEFVPFTIPLRDTHFRSSTLGSGLKYSCNFMLNIWAIETHLNETQAEMTSQPKLSEHSITYVLSVGSECPLIYLVFCVIFVLYTSPLIVWLSVC